MADIPALITWVFIFSLTVTNSADGQKLSVSPTESEEMTNATLTCDATDIPDDDTVTFTHEWEGETIREMPETSKGNRSTHTLLLLSIQDAGEYYCKAGTEISKKLQLALKAAPRLTSLPYDVVYTDVDRAVNLTSKFLHIYSSLTFVRWSRNGRHINGRDTGKSETMTAYRMYGKNINITESTVWITWSVTSSDFGLYDVTVCTNGGCSSAIIELKLLTPPLPPAEFGVVDNLTDGFWFSWRSDSNAVIKQTFQLSYKRADTADDWYSKQVQENTGPGVLVHARISGLAVNTGYDVRVRAVYTQDKNKMSSYTDKLPIFITGSAPERDLGVGAGVGIGMSVMVFVGALVYLAIFLLHRNKRRGHTSTPMDTSCSSDDAYSTKTQMSRMSTKSINPYQSSPPKEVLPDLPRFPAPTSRPSRPAMPRPPIPGDRKPVSKGPPKTAALSPPAQRSTCQKKGSDPKHPPLPLPPTVDDVYEPVEGEGEEEGEESGQEYMYPRMAYENM